LAKIVFRDNEKPSRQAVVPAFKAQARAISNEDVSPNDPTVHMILITHKYARYLEQTHNPKLPASWSETNTYLNGSTNGNGHANGHTNGYIPLSNSYLEGKAVRTVYGPVPLKYALDWPVFASYDELAGCAKWMGGSIPTLEQARSIYKYVDCLKLKEAEQNLGKFVPAVNGYVLCSGVEDCS
jgi:hypothetical protein